MSSLRRLTVVLLVAIPGCASLIGADFERPAAREGELDGATPSGIEGGPDGGDCAMTCGPPPANACIDATTLRAYVSRGTCVGKEECGYAHYDVLCANGCKAGACLGLAVRHEFLQATTSAAIGTNLSLPGHSTRSLAA